MKPAHESEQGADRIKTVIEGLLEFGSSPMGTQRRQFYNSAVSDAKALIATLSQRPTPAIIDEDKPPHRVCRLHGCQYKPTPATEQASIERGLRILGRKPYPAPEGKE